MRAASPTWGDSSTFPSASRLPTPVACEGSARSAPTVSGVAGVAVKVTRAITGSATPIPRKRGACASSRASSTCSSTSRGTWVGSSAATS